jgi:hypothetical protein
MYFKRFNQLNSKIMKTFTIGILVICMGMMAMGQSRMNAASESRLKRSVPAVTADFTGLPLQVNSVVPHSKSALETTLGGSRYDMQTNQAISNRICLFPDGTMSAVWTQGFTDPNYADRGTGYNYFDGTSWSPAPTSRIENLRTGWPCIQPVNGNGEIIICHRSGTAELVVETRPVKGTGAWTTSTIQPPSGASGLGWQRIMTSGPTNNFVHMIVITTPTASGGTAYQGLDPALLYYRSPDGGNTWDKEAVILPQLTSADYDGFAGDIYAWGTPHGDTIYFAVGAPYSDTFIMKSNDNGNTWTKIPVLSNANKKIPAAITDLPPWKSADGSMAVEMDHSGIIHLAFGVGGGVITAGTKYITGNFNGLVYWNTTMPMLQDSLNLDTLDAHGQLLAYVSDGPNPGDTLMDVPFYRVALTSFPQITVDDYNNIYFLWSAATPGNPDPNNMNYRHIFGRSLCNGYASMSPVVDLNSDFIYIFQEYVYEALAKTMLNNELQLIYQTSSQPGSNIASTTIPIHDVTIEHRTVAASLFWWDGIKETAFPAKFIVSQIYPNPAKGQAGFDLTIVSASKVSIEISNIAGEQLITVDKGVVPAGKQNITLDVSRLAPGIYFYTVRVNGDSVTRKMVVN